MTPRPLQPLHRLVLLGAVLMCSATLVVAQSGRPAEPLPTEQMRALAMVYDLLKTSLAEPTGGDKLLIGAIRGMVREADPEGGEYFTEEEFKAFRSGAQGGPAGIGVEVARRGYQTVVMPIAGQPADVAGVKAGDVLLAIDGKALGELNLRDVVGMLRGPVGSKLRLRLLRESAPQPVELEIERQIVTRRTWSLTRPEPDVAVLAVPVFSDGLLDELGRRLGEQWVQQPWRGLVLDLRGNTGGVVQQAIGLAALFLPERAMVAKISGRTEQANQTFLAVPSDYRTGGGWKDPLKPLPPALREGPMVVLVDGGTAAGAEIVTAALKDHRRAAVVGRTTFGRGSIQTITPLQGLGAVKFTSGHWESPSGVRIHAVGVQPDEAIAPGQPAARELAAAIVVLKKRL